MSAGGQFFGMMAERNLPGFNEDLGCQKAGRGYIIFFVFLPGRALPSL
jgi:hypothetical protein